MEYKYTNKCLWQHQWDVDNDNVDKLCFERLAENTNVHDDL